MCGPRLLVVFGKLAIVSSKEDAKHQTVFQSPKLRPRPSRDIIRPAGSEHVFRTLKDELNLDLTLEHINEFVSVVSHFTRTEALLWNELRYLDWTVIGARQNHAMRNRPTHKRLGEMLLSPLLGDHAHVRTSL